MQTFLSEPTFAESAAVLDNKRLNKQLLEGYQILKAISQTPQGGGSRVDGKVPFASNHPATNQWRGHEDSLMVYLTTVELEARGRNIKTDKNWSNIMDIWKPMFEANIAPLECGIDIPQPRWWTDQIAKSRVILTHRRNLFYKDVDHYAQYAEDAERVDSNQKVWVCCSTHAPYYYPTHTKEFQ